MKLAEILNGIGIIEVRGSLESEATHLAFDSRRVTAGTLFVAVKGTRTDGHQFIEKAMECGAVAVVAEALPEAPPEGATLIRVSDSAEALGWMASNFFGRPSRRLKLVGVTGTNGKTTTVTLLNELFTELGYRSGMLSTIENRIERQVLPATHTTPDAIAINGLLAEMAEAGCDYVFMEVSSHAADQKRIAGLHFAGAVFTNISHDHLDYHQTFRAYIDAKKSFFDRLPATAFALVNADDKRGEVMVQNTRAKVYRYSLRKMADFMGRILDNSLKGLHLEIDGKEFFGRLIGAFNAYNILAVFAVAVLLGQEESEVLIALSQMRAPEGRFDYLLAGERQVTAIVDYAHTPDALEKVLSTLVRVKEDNARLISVIGCGGDRDKGKRPKMAKIACSYSDQVILTSDNPRTEDPALIIRDMESGVPPFATRKVLTIVDRAEAIKTACRLAGKGDVVLVAGKGHEKYQEINGVRYPFDDKEVLKAELNA